jgi:hypothetical protein
VDKKYYVPGSSKKTESNDKMKKVSEGQLFAKVIEEKL